MDDSQRAAGRPSGQQPAGRPSRGSQSANGNANGNNNMDRAGDPGIAVGDPSSREQLRERVREGLTAAGWEKRDPRPETGADLDTRTLSSNMANLNLNNPGVRDQGRRDQVPQPQAATPTVSITKRTGGGSSSRSSVYRGQKWSSLLSSGPKHWAFSGK